MNHILIIGATSAIAVATARRYAARGAHLYLLARDVDALERLAADLRIRGARGVDYDRFDAAAPEHHAEALARAFRQPLPIDAVLVAYGTLSNQAACQASVEATLAEWQINATSTIALLTDLGNRFEAQGHGTIAVIGSVAGDRGRQSNYVYGAAKAAVATFLQGLRNRLYPKGVHVLTIKPGFVDTPMTAHLAKGVLWATPDTIAAGIERAIQRGRNVVYLPFWWEGIMTIIKLVPEAIFKRLKL